MNQPARFVRRNRVDERTAAAIAVLAAAVALFSGAQPTGHRVVDALTIFISVGAVVWAAASAPWWMVAAAAGVGAVVAFDPVVATIGAMGFMGGLLVGVRRQDLSEVRSVVGAVAANVLIRSDLEGFLGLSALIGIGCGIALLVVGLRRRPSSIRKAGWIACATVGAAAVVAVLGVAVAGVGARPDVTEAASTARQAVDALNEGDYQAAADLFETSAAGFRRADNRLGGLLASPARLVPGISQNVTAGADLSAAAATATSEAAASLRQIDPSTLQVAGGSIDLEAVRSVETPLQRVQDALAQLRDVVADTDSPWVAGPIRSELDELQADFDDNEERLENALDAVRLAPALLGGDGSRRYLILFTSPAEARGLGGFVGNYAEIEIDNGTISVAKFARRSELEDANQASPAFCAACPAELLQRYGRFGLNTGPDDAVGSRGWSNITMAAHFPYVAEAAQVLYPQSGGNPIDGVILMDPYVIQALMAYTGPIEVPELDTTVPPADAAKFILEDQYILAGDDANLERIDALGTLGDQVILRLLTGSLPEPPELARDLGPLVEERRLLVWTDEPAEQELLDRVGLLGALPALSPTDGGFSVSVTNAGASKIDVFLERDVDVAVVTGDDGTRRLVADVTLINNAPSSGLPRYVIGNVLGEPDGFSRLFVTFYGISTLATAELDGEPLAVEALPEAGWTAYGTYVDLAAGGRASMHLEFDLVPPGIAADLDPADEQPRPPTVWEQPLATRE